jgi:hypothetical protein
LLQCVYLVRLCYSRAASALQSIAEVTNTTTSTIEVLFALHVVTTS